MTIGLGDRWIENALREHWRADTTEAMAERIVGAWLTGARAVAPPPPSRRPRVTLALGLAGLAAGLAVAALLLLRRPDSAAFEVGPGAWVLDAAGVELRPARQARSGECVLVGETGTVLGAPGRFRAELEAGALVRNSGPALELHRGALTFAVGARAETEAEPAPELRAIGVRVVPAPDSELRVELHEFPPPVTTTEDPSMTIQQIRDRIAGLGALPAALSVLVLSGSAELATAQGKERVPAGASRRVDRHGANPDEVWRQRLRDAFAAAQKSTAGLDASDPKVKARLEHDLTLAESLGTLLLEHPEGFVLVRADLHAKLRDPKTPDDVVDQLFDALALDPSPEAETIAAKLWQRSAMRGSTDDKIAFAERGNAAAQRMLREEFAKAQQELAKTGDDGRELQTAVYLGLRNDPIGKQMLAEAMEVDHLEVPFVRRSEMCGRALQALGDGAPLAKYHTMLRIEVDARLKQELVQEAGWLVANAEYFAKHAIDGKSGSLAFVDRRAQIWQEKRARDLATPEAIRKLLDQVAPPK